MNVRRRFLTIPLAAALVFNAAAKLRGADPPVRGIPPRKVYGEWRILVKPDKGPDYNALIENAGLPLFRQAGGRMVGWWNTLIGNLYEQVTIWEYDDMAAFERAVDFLGHEKRFAEFVARRDPLLNGEHSRFLTPADRGVPPVLADPTKFVIHEIHRVPLKKSKDYLDFMTSRGLALLQRHGFRPVGPWTVEVGNWNEITYLFRFNSLEERTRLMTAFSANADAAPYLDAMKKYVDEITTRLLVPAPFTAAAGAKLAPVSSSLLPHVEQIADGVFAAGFADRFGSANCGWVRGAVSTMLVDLPRGVGISQFVDEVERLAGRPVRRLVLTKVEAGDERLVEALSERGISDVLASPADRARLAAAWSRDKPFPVKVFPEPATAKDDGVELRFMPADGIAGRGGAAVFLPQSNVLFAGPLVCHGPRTQLAESDTRRWVARLKQLEALRPTAVVPGRGSWGGPGIVIRQRRFLAELRRQVAYAVAQGRPESSLKDEIRISADFLVWMPYDTPTAEDCEHVYRELTVPVAPYDGHPPRADDSQTHALVLIGDQPHEPGHIVEGLGPVFAETNVVPHFTVDVRALSAENLAHVKLLVILRDGLQRPTNDPAADYVWMTPQQQAAVEQFVLGGGAFLNLHNSMGLYPDQGPYLKLVGGRYIGHGPLERFRVEVVDGQHPITRGVESFWVADEQHTPPYDAGKVHLLLRNRSDDGKTVAAAGWAYESGRGRLCHLANGHTLESLQHPMYQRLLRNAVNWCLRREIK